MRSTKLHTMNFSIKCQLIILQKKKPSGNPFKNKQEYFVENICENMFPKVVLKRKLNNRKNLNILLPSALQYLALLGAENS